MAIISYKMRGDFSKTDTFLKRLLKKDFLRSLEQYGQEGVDALSSATPVRTGLTASSWRYEIHRSGPDVSLVWTNSNINKGVPIAIVLQYGHGTRNGGYVQGIDYINPAIRPIFDKIAESVAKEVSNL